MDSNYTLQQHENASLESRNYDDIDDTSMLAYCTISIIIAVLAFVGNFIVVFIVVKAQRMQSFTNWLILNLAISDIATALISIPFEIPSELKHGEWQYHPLLCHFFYPLQSAIVYGSVFTLVFLSLSRYWAIVYPFRQQLKIYHAKILIIVIWMFCFLFTIPYAMALRYNTDTNSCEERWSYNDNLIYTIAIFAFQYILPLTIISLAYLRIVYDLCYTNEANANGKINKTKQAETKKIIKLLIIITISFAGCLLPYHVVALYQLIYPDVVVSRYISDLSFLILYSNSALNPFIYNAFNEKFRKSFKEFYRRNICCKRSFFHDSDSSIRKLLPKLGEPINCSGRKPQVEDSIVYKSHQIKLLTMTAKTKASKVASRL